MKLIASDFDGTLNFGGVSREDREAIKRFRDAGNKFVVVTGRDLELARWIMFGDERLDIDFYITCTGALITDGDGRIVYENPGETGSYIEELVSDAAKYGAWALNVTYRTIKNQLDCQGIVPRDFYLLKKFTHCNTWFSSDEKAKEFCALVSKKYADHINPCQNGHNVDMPPAGNSKTSGIYKCAQLLGNPEIYTVGDNFNDIPMLKEFNSFAVSNAKDEVKKTAKHTCNRICDMIDFIMNEG